MASTNTSHNLLYAYIDQYILTRRSIKKVLQTLSTRGQLKHTSQNLDKPKRMTIAFG